MCVRMQNPSRSVQFGGAPPTDPTQRPQADATCGETVLDCRRVMSWPGPPHPHHASMRVCKGNRPSFFRKGRGAKSWPGLLQRVCQLPCLFANLTTGSSTFLPVSWVDACPRVWALVGRRVGVNLAPETSSETLQSLVGRRAVAPMGGAIVMTVGATSKFKKQ